MNKVEAAAIADEELDTYRAMSYSEIVPRVGSQETFERTSVNGDPYRVEVEFFYDSDGGGPIRVGAAVSYSGWTDFFPVSSDFIKDSNNEFVGE